MIPAPALCGPYTPGLKPSEWAAEPKLDGMRLLLHVKDGKVHAYGRADKREGEGSRDGYLCALEEELQSVLGILDDTILDGEAVILNGRADFNLTMRIMGLGTAVKAAAEQRRTGRYVSFMAWDVLRLRGDSTVHLPYDERRRVLTIALDMLPAAPHLVMVPMVHLDEVGADVAFGAMLDLFGEGCVYKRRSSRYPSGLRSPDWQKRKQVLDADCVVMGFIPGKNSLVGQVGAIVFGQFKDGVLTERGSCAGFTSALRDWITEHIEELVAKRQVFTLTYNGIVPGGTTFRFPQWHAWRDDKLPEECYWDG
jgi:bifunctional non-homologous end joining protein LigD